MTKDQTDPRHDGQAAEGVNRQLPHLGNAGQGVNRKLPHLGNAGQGRTHYIYEWFGALQDRTRGVRVAVGDWQRATTRAGTRASGLLNRLSTCLSQSGRLTPSLTGSPRMTDFIRHPALDGIFKEF